MHSTFARTVRSAALTLTLSVPMGAHAFAIISSDPADGAVLTSKPPFFLITMDEAYKASSVQSSDFTIDGVPSDGFLTAAIDKLAFSYLPALNLGFHVISMAGGAIESSTDVPINAFSATFEIRQAPEPASLALLGLGLAGLGAIRRKRS